MDDDLTPGDILLLVEKLADLGTWRFDIDDFSAIMSPQALRQLGLPAGRGSRVEAEEWDVIYGRERVEAARAAIHRAAETNEVYRMELPVLTDGEQPRWILSVGKVFNGPRGRELIGFNMNITRAKRAELDRDRERDRYERCARAAAVNAGAAGVIHEIMQPLTAASLTMEGINRLAAREGVSVELAERIDAAFDLMQQAGRVARSTRRFLREGSADASSVNLLALASATIAELREQQPRTIDVTLDARTPSPTGRFDGTLIKQLFANLLANALDASERDADVRIEITYRCRAGRHLFVFRDFGSGVDPDLQRQLQRPFGAPAPSGLGLGLWLCNAIARLHHGSLRIAAADPGTCAIVQLRSI